MNKMAPYRAEMDGNTYFSVKPDTKDRMMEEFERCREYISVRNWGVEHTVSDGNYVFLNGVAQVLWEGWRAALKLKD